MKLLDIINIQKNLQNIIDQLLKLKENLDYIKNLPKENEEKLIKLVEKIKQKKEQLAPPKTTRNPVKPNVFKLLEKSTQNAKFSIPEIDSQQA